MSSHVLVWRTAEIWLVGPFDNDKAASDWAIRNNPHDNPCWQVVSPPVSVGALQHTIRVDLPEWGRLPK